MILLTGASGVVGSAVLRRLGAEDVISLVRTANVPGLTVAGDIRAPRLGVDRASYAALVDKVDTVIHCAGTTDFSADAAATRTSNVDGTRHIVAFAEDAGARLVYSSTAFVARLDLPHLRAADRAAAVTPARYLESKLAAEELVAASAAETVIARLAVVMGDAATGEMARFQGLHTTTLALLRGLVPVLPFTADAALDVLPSDVVADALIALARRPAPDAVQWITAGDRALPIGRIVELAGLAVRDAGVPAPTPRFVRRSMVDRLVRPTFIDPLPEPRRRQFDNLMALASLFEDAPPFPTTLGPALPGPAELEAAFVASVRHLARVKGLIR